MRYLLTQLFYWEGRLDEMRRLVQERWNTSPNQAGDLRSLWQIDSAVVMVDLIQAAVEQAASKAPDDDRVWLARANLALLRGRLSDAARWLDACLKRRLTIPSSGVPGSGGRAPPIRSTRHAARSRTCPPNGFRPPRCLTLRAWFAAREGRADQERIALEQVIDQAPGDTQALERLAVLAARVGAIRSCDRAAPPQGRHRSGQGAVHPLARSPTRRSRSSPSSPVWPRS